MNINNEIWPSFLSYLLIDRKMSDTPESISSLKSRFKRISTWFTEKDFNLKNFRELIMDMRGSGYKPSHINKVIGLCKHLDRYLKTNIISDFSLFHETCEPKETLSIEEIQRLADLEIAYTKGKEYLNARQKTIIMLLGTSGARIGEVLNLKWDDIYSTPRHIVFRKTKNGEARTVPIGEAVYQLIDSLPRKSEYIFVGYRGTKKLRPQEVNLDLKRRAIAVGITNNVYPHLFRHSYITTMLESGVDCTDVCKLSGHKNVNSILRYKNSLLGHYCDIVQLHPLLRESLTIDQISKQMKNQIERLVDTSQFQVKYTQDNGSFSFAIQQTPN